MLPFRTGAPPTTLQTSKSYQGAIGQKKAPIDLPGMIHAATIPSTIHGGPCLHIWLFNAIYIHAYIHMSIILYIYRLKYICWAWWVQRAAHAWIFILYTTPQTCRREDYEFPKPEISINKYSSLLQCFPFQPIIFRFMRQLSKWIVEIIRTNNDGTLIPILLPNWSYKNPQWYENLMGMEVPSLVGLCKFDGNKLLKRQMSLPCG